ncbi:hypothetical protein ACHAWO_001535 [Cyclotella atomus]|uniref:Homeobox domain-containing protein n=1 Tax=Cyclotella atomus TaxID=382360 RepID=A0ABD3MXF2_9STRA
MHIFLNILSWAKHDALSDVDVQRSLLEKLDSVLKSVELDYALYRLIQAKYVKIGSETYELIQILRRLIRTDSDEAYSKHDRSHDTMEEKNLAVSMLVQENAVWLLKKECNHAKEQNYRFGDESFHQDEEDGTVFQVNVQVVRNHLISLRKQGGLSNIPCHVTLNIVPVELDERVIVPRGVNRIVQHDAHILYVLEQSDQPRPLLDILTDWCECNKSSSPTDEQIRELVQHEPSLFGLAEAWFQVRRTGLSSTGKSVKYTGEMIRKLTTWYQDLERSKTTTTEEHKREIGLTTGLTTMNVTTWLAAHRKNQKASKSKKQTLTEEVLDFLYADAPLVIFFSRLLGLPRYRLFNPLHISIVIDCPAFDAIIAPRIDFP